jgi:hypothetical protein
MRPNLRLALPSRRPRPVASAPSLGDRENRSIGIGIACTILFHVLLLCLAPFFPADKISGVDRFMEGIAAQNRAKEFNIELADADAEQQKLAPFRFVETNPDAPENEPDKTINVSNRNQQSAQEERPPEIDPENRPSIRGRDDIQNDSAIVSGNMSRTEVAAAAEAMMKEAAAAQAAQELRAEQVPLSGQEKILGTDEEGVGSNISQLKSPSNQAEDYLEGAKDGRSATGALTQTEQANRPVPRERPRLTQARPTVLQNRIRGTSNIGPLGYDARWSEYGDYMQELIEVVQASWEGLLRDARAYPKAGTSVIVTFTLNSSGEVSIVSVEETTGAAGAYVSTTAITSRQPYRKWTDQMIAVLGQQQTMTFRFFFY